MRRTLPTGPGPRAGCRTWPPGAGPDHAPPGRRTNSARRCAWAGTVLAPAWWLLTGCADPAASGVTTPGLQLGLALSVCALAAGLAWLGYRLGQARERQQQQALLAQAAQAAAESSASSTRALSAASEAERSLREALRHAETLQAGWRWQTDASHQLLALHPPAVAGDAPLGHHADQRAGSSHGAGEPAWPQLAVAPRSSGLAQDLAQTLTQALPALLQAQRPVADARIHAQADGNGWRLRAEPRFDAHGHFQGCQGVAWSTATEDALAATQQHIGALLQALPWPLLLATSSAAGTDAPGQASATQSPGGWRLARLNPAAQRLLPDARPGQVLADCLSAWPGTMAALAQSLPGLAPGESCDADGWRLSCLCAPAPGVPSLLVCATAPTAAPQSGTPLAEISEQGGESDQLSFTLSHDLRAPIRVVEGFTRIVKEDYGRLLDRVGNDHLDRVLGATARMNLMIDALLTLARLSSQPLARQPVNLTQLAHYVTDELKRQHPERHAEVFIEPGLGAVGDPTLLRLVLENLLGNAWKYSARSTRTHIEFRSETVDGRAAFVVRDQGAGFDMRSADRLFGLFQRLHSTNDFPGTGVGLASVRRIVRRHGGDIWAVAEPGRGASFHFTLAA